MLGQDNTPIFTDLELFPRAFLQLSVAELRYAHLTLEINMAKSIAEESIENFTILLLSQRLLVERNPATNVSQGITKNEIQMRALRGVSSYSIDVDHLCSIPTALEEISSLILYHPPLRRAIFRIIDTQDESYFEANVPPLFEEFLKDLWLEKWWRIRANRKLRARSRSGHPCRERVWTCTQNRHQKLLGVPHTERQVLEIANVMKRIWCVNSIFWSYEDYWKCSGEHEVFVRQSTALAILIDGLRDLRKDIVEIECQE